MWWIPNELRDGGIKAESRTQEGTYLGIRNQTSESLIAIEDGITSARTVRRMPADSRWNKDAVLDVKKSVAANGYLGVEPADTRDITSGGDMVVNRDAHEKSICSAQNGADLQFEHDPISSSEPVGVESQEI